MFGSEKQWNTWKEMQGQKKYKSFLPFKWKKLSKDIF